ncbi:MAG: tryptophan 7-halogenase [Chloroflexi bacterium]|nr:tryptophan 7-halogenase [Chloroflexota bacterium]
MLLSNAIRRGSNVYQNHRVTRLLHADGRVVGVAYSRPDGTEGEVKSAYTLIATGQDSLALERSHSLQYNEDFKNIAVFSYYSPAVAVPNWDPDEPRGNQIVVAFEHGWFWVIPQNEHYSSVGAVVSHRSFQQLQQMGSEAFLDAMIALCPHVAALVSDARRIEPVRVIRDYSFTFKDYCGPGYFRAGDAAVFVDPLWSYGVSNAMRTAVLAACSINSLLGATPGAREEVLQGAYQDTLKSFYDHMIRLLLYFYNAHRDMRSYFWKTHNLSYAIRESSHKQTFIKVLSGGSYLLHDKLEQRSSEADSISESAREVFDRFAMEGDRVPLNDSEWTDVAIAEVFDSLADPHSSAIPSADARLVANYPLKSYLYVDPEKLVAQALVSVYHQNRLTTLSSVALDVVREADGRIEVSQLLKKVAANLSVSASTVHDELKVLLDSGIIRAEK